jgi:putative DNA primase/helicase
MQDFTEQEVNSCLEFHPKTGEVVAVNHHALASMILQHLPMATIVETKELLVYVKGHFVPNGTEIVHQCLVKLLAPYHKQNGQTAYNIFLLKEVLNIIHGMTYAESKIFDSNLDIINCTNGLLNWRTGEFTEHTPDYLSRIQINVDYDPEATCPTILDVFNTILRKEDFRKALEFIAYCLYRKYPIQKAFILLGPGGTGKSHFIDVIRALLSEENVSSTSMHDLEEDRFASSDLLNKLLNENGDLSQQTLPNVNVLKMLVSNKDVIRAQRKGERAFDFINFAKIIFASNKLPRVKDDTSGFYRRIEILPFEHIFSEQEKLDSSEKLKNIVNPRELSGLLNIIIPYLEPLLERGCFSNSFEVATAKDQYKRQSEPIASFVEACIKEVADEYVAKEVVYAEYIKFCKINHIDPLHIVPFGKALKQCIPWYQHGIRDFGGERHTCLCNTMLIKLY